MFSGLKTPAFISWPVGCGDATTIVVDDAVNIQLDLNDTNVAEQSDNERIPVINELVAKLPTINGRPYLSCFILSHPDEDHCRGFKRLLKEVTIGELWFTPRIFDEYHKDLSEDASAFKTEAARRVKEMISARGDAGRGNRVRIIGYSDRLQKPGYTGFPASWLTIPGNPIYQVDGYQLQEKFHAFVHAPFKDDSAGERNETSLALQIRITNGGRSAYGLYLGDLSYSTLRRVFDETRKHNNMGFLAWHVLLAPHHCSKSAMYIRQDGKELLQQDILDELNGVQLDGGTVIVSSDCFPAANKEGDNPPHLLARRRYEEIASQGLICTGEHSTTDRPIPVITQFTGGKIDTSTQNYSLCSENAELLLRAIASVQGGFTPPTQKVGFGCNE